MTRLASLGALMAVAAMGAAHTEIVFGEPDVFRGPEPKDPPAPVREARSAGRDAADRVLTEVDNTRLRLAAERRYHKAQRQAKGIVG